MNTLIVIFAQLYTVIFTISSILEWKKYNNDGVEYNFRVWREVAYFFASLACAFVVWEWFLGLL